MPTPETLRQLLAAYEACESKKGEDTRILSLDPADSGLADFFLITSASNDRQVVAIADEIEFSLKQNFGLYATSVEGRRQGEWILLDYTDIVIHVFLAEKRAFYDIERLRKSARNLTGADVEAELKTALAEKTRAVRSTKPAATKAAPTKTAKGDSTVSAKKAVKKAVKPAAKKAAPKPAAKKAAAKKAPAKAPAKKAVATRKPTPGKASVAAPKAPMKKAVAKKAATKGPAPKGVLAPVGVVAPVAMAAGRGAKPPIIKVQPRLPNPITLAAAEAPAPPVKKKK